MWNRKGYLSQNCLFICDVDFFSIYSLCRWDGSVADAALWNDAHTNDLRIPPGKYFLADAGFGSSDVLLVPYCGVHYHLKEWRQANLRNVPVFSFSQLLFTNDVQGLRIQENCSISGTQDCTM
jgi:DDE superfamily endonuclease